MPLTIEHAIPSRQRSHMIGNALKLFPEANVYVHESEYDDYLGKVPAGQLKTHNVETGIAPIREVIATGSDADCVVALDDDILGVRCLLSKTGLIRDPDYVKQVIENAAYITSDLGLHAFTFGISMNPIRVRADVDPIDFTPIMHPPWGLVGGGKQYPCSHVSRHADIELAFQAYKRSRVIYCDQRFVFENTPQGSGTGGDVTNTSSKLTSYKDTYRDFKRRWGCYYQERDSLAGAPKIPRKNKLVNVREYYPGEIS